MELHLSADQQAFIRKGIESGRLQSHEDAFEQAMALWEERERRRMEILLAVKASEDSLHRGAGRTISNGERSRQLVEDIKRRGMERLTAEKNQR